MSTAHIYLCRYTHDMEVPPAECCNYRAGSDVNGAKCNSEEYVKLVDLEDTGRGV